MEEDLVPIDYDTIQAPQFVDFESFSLEDDEEDPALRFFEVGVQIQDPRSDSEFEEEQVVIVNNENQQQEPPPKKKKKEVSFEGQVLLPDANDAGLTLPDPVIQSVITAEAGQVQPLVSDDHGQGNCPESTFREPPCIETDEEDPSGLTDVANLSRTEKVLAQGHEDEHNQAQDEEMQQLVCRIEDLQLDLDDHFDKEPTLVEHAEKEIPERDPSQAEAHNQEVVTDEPEDPPTVADTEVVDMAPAVVPCREELPKMKSRITVPKPFHFQDSRFKATVPEHKKSQTFSFKARPAPIKVLHGLATGMKEKMEIKVTVPVAPHFASDDRIKSRHQRSVATASTEASTGIKENVEPRTRGRARSVSVSSTPVRGANAAPVGSARRGRSPSPAVRLGDRSSHTVTVMKPFSFEEREKERQRLKNEKLRRQQELAAELKPRPFHANPLPSFKPNLPPKNIIPATIPEPFQLKVDERGTKHQEMLRQKLEEEERQRKEQAKFYANPPTVIFKHPFEPEGSEKLPTEPLDIVLNSEVRAQAREQYDNQLKEREMIEEQINQEEGANRLLMEQKQTQDLRKQLVHKAQPVKGTRCFEVKQSTKPLTTPMSPAFKPLPSQRRNLHQIYDNAP